MGILGRAGRSVIRKPIKSILLFFVVFAISLFLLSGMASRTANVKTQDKTRQAVGTGLLLEANEANRHKRLNEITKSIGGEGTMDGVTIQRVDTIYGTQVMVTTDNSFETLRMDDIKKLAGISGICDYNITTAVTAVNPINFQRIEDEDVDQYSDIGGVSLIGNYDMQMDTNVLSGNVSVKSGRMVGKEDTDVCVVSEELASQNHLKIGDRLQFNGLHDTSNSTAYEAEIIGIYSVLQYMAPYMSGDTFRSENVIFTDLGFPEKAENEENPLYEKAYFKVEDARIYDTAKETMKQADIDWERYDLIDNNGNYDTMSANFNDLERISEALVWVVALASFLILFLIFVFWMKSRVQEVGIFLAVGIPKMKIILQILLEAAMIAAVAVAFSFAAAPKASELAANYLVGKQVQQAQEKKELDAGNVAFDFAEAKQEVTGVSVPITMPMMLSDAASILILTSLSVITAGTGILRKKPRDILSEMS